MTISRAGLFLSLFYHHNSNHYYGDHSFLALKIFRLNISILVITAGQFLIIDTWFSSNIP